MTSRRGSGDAEEAPSSVSSAAHVDGTVREQLEYALYRVELDSHHEVVAHTPGGTGRNFIRLLVGDRVRVALSPRDAKRGRIVRKL
jgi:translation initiation factor IF-1